MRLEVLDLGGRRFAVPLGEIDALRALYRTDPAAAIARARAASAGPMQDGQTLHVPAFLCDALPPHLAAMAARVQSELGHPAVNDTIRIGDADVAADPRIVAEFQRLQAQLSDALTASAGAALIADAARRRAPGTARGDYIRRMERAYLNPASVGRG